MLPHGGDMLLPTPTISFFCLEGKKNLEIDKYFLFVEVFQNFGLSLREKQRDKQKQRDRERQTEEGVHLF